MSKHLKRGKIIKYTPVLLRSELEIIEVPDLERFNHKLAEIAKAHDDLFEVVLQVYLREHLVSYFYYKFMEEQHDRGLVVYNGNAPLTYIIEGSKLFNQHCKKTLGTIYDSVEKEALKEFKQFYEEHTRVKSTQGQDSVVSEPISEEGD